MEDVTEPSIIVRKMEIEVCLKSYVNKYTSNEKIKMLSVRMVKKRRFLKTMSTRAPDTSTPIMLPVASHVSLSLIPV